jgi:hypothetical protein
MHDHFKTWCLPSANGRGPLLGPSYWQKLTVSCIFAVVKYVYAVLLERCAFCEVIHTLYYALYTMHHTHHTYLPYTTVPAAVRGPAQDASGQDGCVCAHGVLDHRCSGVSHRAERSGREGPVGGEWCAAVAAHAYLCIGAGRRADRVQRRAPLHVAAVEGGGRGRSDAASCAHGRSTGLRRE